MSRQEATPSKQVCQENRLKVGLQVNREKEGHSGPALNTRPLHSIPNLTPLGLSPSHFSLFFWGHRHLILSPKVGGRGPLQAEAGQVHCSIGHQVEDSDHCSQCVQLPSQEHQLDTYQEAEH